MVLIVLAQLILAKCWHMCKLLEPVCGCNSWSHGCTIEGVVGTGIGVWLKLVIEVRFLE